MAEHGGHNEAQHTAAKPAAHHEAPKPAHREAPATHHAAHAAPANGQQAPFFRGVNWVQRKGDEVSAAAQGFRAKIRGLLKFEKPHVEDVGIAKTLPYAVGHVADGTIMNAGRRAYELAEPGSQALGAAYRTCTGTLFLQFLRHPIEYIKNWCRMATSQVVATKNFLRIPDRAIDDAVGRGIDSTIQQINTQFAKVPLVGPIFKGVTNTVTGIASWITGKVRGALDFCTDWVDKVHEAMSPDPALS